MVAKKRAAPLIEAAVALLAACAGGGGGEGEGASVVLALDVELEVEPPSSLAISATGGNGGVTKFLVSKCTGGGGLYSATSFGSSITAITSPGFKSCILYASGLPVHKFPVATNI